MCSASLLSAMSEHSKRPLSTADPTSQRTEEEKDDAAASWDPKPEKMYVPHEALPGGSSPPEIALAVLDSRAELETTSGSLVLHSPDADRTPPSGQSSRTRYEKLALYPEGSMQPPGKKRRTSANCPVHMAEEVWTAGVDWNQWIGMEPLTIRYAPPEAWEQVTVYVHPTATAGDVKWFLQQKTNTKHNCCTLVGESGVKVPWWSEILISSMDNPNPNETRVLVPSDPRFLSSVACHSNPCKHRC